MIVGDDMGKNTKKKKNAGSTAAYRKADMEARKFVGRVNADLHKAHDIGMMKATAIILWMMRKEYGFGRKRILRMVETIHQYCLDYIVPVRAKGKPADVPLEEMCRELAEDCGIYIDLKKGKIYGSKEAMEVDV